MKKKPTLYIIIIAVWLLGLGVLAWSLAAAIANITAAGALIKAFITALLSINTACIAVLWFGSVKDLVFSLAAVVLRKKFDAEYAKIKPADTKSAAPRVALLYCTCNDFNADALTACRKQNYSNFYTVILDDSSDAEYIRKINKYRATHGNVTVHRRADKSGFKAGNLNSYLKNNSDYDYFVVLDSDEIIPPDYIVSALKYFDNFGNCGAVQAKHRASEGTNAFQSLMGMCVLSNGSTVQIVKNFYGANALMGHGMMISRQCYQKTSGFPLVVAEDISFAVDIKNAGYEIIYAPDIECTEEFPVNYVSLKKRQCKWTQGNLEYMRKYDGDINKSDMKWFEKLDLKLSHYSLPVVPMLGFMLMLCTIALGFAGYTSIKYSLIVYSIMLLFLCSPLIPDVLVYCKGRKIWLLIPYFIVNIAAYASLSPMMISTIIKGCCGKKASFIVTPKTGKKFSLKEAAVYSWDSVAFATAMCILAVAACGSVLPVIFVAAGCLAAPAIVMLSNIPAKKPRAQKPQRPVSSDFAEKNALPAANVTVASAPVITRTAGILPAKSAVNTSANIGSAVKTSMTRGR